MDQSSAGTNGNNPNNNNNNNNNNANLRVVVDTLIADIKDKRDLIGAKNNQIRDLLTRLEKINLRLGERENTIDELKKKLENSVPELIRDFDNTHSQVFPVEILDKIFHYSSACTRINFASTNTFYYQRYQKWNDVTSVYITRQPVKQLPKATIIPQAYLIRTNVPSVSTFSSTNLIQMAPSLFFVKQMLIESSQNRMASEWNRIPIQSGFFSHFANLEYIKICNISSNLSLRYKLHELLALPHLKTLHLRELGVNFVLPDVKEITAPIEQLRISIPYRSPEKLEGLFRALSPTLTSLDFTTLRTLLISNINGAGNPGGGELIPAIISACPNLVELHIPSIVSNHASFDSSIPLLKNLTKLKQISIEIMHLSNFVNIVQNLSPSCDLLIITDNFYIHGSLISLTSGTTFAYDKIFTGNNYELLQFECNRIHRNFIVQLGRLRGINPLTIVQNVTPSLQIIANAAIEPKLLMSPQERRVYLSDGLVLSREEFLSQMGIIPVND